MHIITAALYTIAASIALVFCVYIALCTIVLSLAVATFIRYYIGTMIARYNARYTIQ